MMPSTIHKNTSFAYRRAISVFYILLVAQIASLSLVAAETPKVMTAVRILSPPRIDGSLEDDCWKLAKPATGFVQELPDDGELATEQTVIRVTYDDKSVYFGVECLDSQPDKIDARVVPRDADPYPGDLIGIALDTFHDHQNAYCFRTNPRGIQVDFRVYDDFAQGWEGRDFSWDGIWQSEAQVTDKGWVAELAIPFKTLRFPRHRKQTWGVNIQRYQKNRGEDTNWAPITRGDGGALRMSKAGHLVGLEDPKQGMHIELLPYGTFEYSGIPEEDAIEQDAGLDAKYGITSDLTTDLTINPDFGHIEGDEEQINLTRYELFLKEKRPFFMEGKDLFSPMKLFYTRRIRDPRFGANLTGKVGGYSIGLLAAQDNEEEEHPFYGVFRLQRDILEKSSIGIIGAGKEGSGGEYNRAVGMDVSLRPGQGALDLELARSFNPDVSGDDVFASIGTSYYTEGFEVHGGFNQTDPEFRVDEIGYRPHDLHVGEREFWGDGEYTYRLQRFGIYQVSTWQSFTATKRTDDDEWGWNWNNVNLYAEIRNGRQHHSFSFAHEDWFLRWQQKGYRGDTSSLRYSISGMPILDSCGVTFRTGEQYDWGDDYFGSMRSFSLSQRFNILDNLTLNYDAQVVWEYLATKELDEVKRVANFRLTYLPTRDIFIRIFAPINISSHQYAVNALFSYAYRPMSRFYLAYNERRSDEGSETEVVDRIIMAKVSYLWNL